VAVTEAQVLEWVVAAVFLALGCWMLALAWRRRLHRAFLLLCVVEALLYASVALQPYAGKATGIPWRQTVWLAQLALPFAAANFALTVWRGQVHATDGVTPLGWRLARWLCLLGAVAAGVLYLVWPGWFDGNDPVDPIVKATFPLTTAGCAFVLATAQYRLPRGRDRSALTLFSFAFALHPAYQGAFLTLDATQVPDAPSVSWLLMGPLTLALVTAALVVLWRGAHRQRDGGPHLARDVRNGSFAVAIATLSGLVPDLVGLGAPRNVDIALLVTFGAAWNLAFAALLAYAVARYCPFGLNSRLRTLLREGTFLSLVGAVFFIAESVVKDLLQQGLGIELRGGLGLAASAGLALAVTLAMLPVRRACARLALRAVPTLASSALHRRRLEIYRAAVVAARQDGRLTARERRALGTLAASLGLSDVEAHQAAAHS